MNDEEYERQKQRVLDCWLRWRDRFWLDEWELTFEWFREPHDGEAWVFQVEPDWRYIRAHVSAWLPTIAVIDDKKLDQIMCHEIGHILVNEMQPANRRTEDHDHEERVAESIGRALWHGYQADREPPIIQKESSDTETNVEQD